MRVLALNHTGLVSGAEVVTLNLLSGLPREVTAVLACPEGPLADRARAAGIRVAPVPGVAASLRLHPVETARGVLGLARLGRAIRVMAACVGADVVHALSIRAGLAAALAPGLRRPVVVSIHDCLPRGPVTALTQRIIERRSAVVVANSHFTATAWRSGDGRAPRVVHPPVDLDRYRPHGDRAAVRSRLGLGEEPVLGVVAQLTPWKGQQTAVRALAGIRATHPDARLLLAGEAVFVSRATRYDNRAYLASLHRTIDELQLGPYVTFLGRREDVPEVLRALDLLLLPSWEEPFGLVMLEAMAVGTPVVATSRGGPAEVIRDGENGRLVSPHHPERWAEVASELLSSPGLRERFARQGLATAQKFRRANYVQAITGIYDDALS